MARRIAIGAGLAVFVTLAVLFLVLFTDIGARLTVGRLLPAVNDRLNGALTVEQARGPIVRGMELEGVKLIDRNGIALAVAQRVRIEYRLRDLIRKRWIVRRLALVRPEVRLVQEHSGEPPSIARVFESEPAAARSSPTAVELRNVELEHGTVTFERRAGDAFYPPLTHRVFELGGAFPQMRFVIGTTGDAAISVEVRRLEGKADSIARGFELGHGRITMERDSVSWEISAIAVGSSRASARGWTVLGDTLRLEASLEADSIVTSDLRPFHTLVPDGLVGGGSVTVGMTRGRQLSVRADPLAVRSDDGTERLEGRVGFLLDADGRWYQQDTRLRLSDIDVSRTRHFVRDSLPVSGRVTGTVRLDGPRERLRVDVDGDFRDASVRGEPRSALAGGGSLALLPAGPRLTNFRVARSRIQLASLERFVRTAGLGGLLEFGGTVNGTREAFEVVGRLAHVSQTGGSSILSGSFGTEQRRGTMAVRADVRVDSVQRTTLRTFGPQAELLAPLAGQVALEGRLDSIGFRARFVSAALGEIDGVGRVVRAGERLLLHVDDGGVSALDLSQVRPGLPPSTVYARLSGGGVVRPPDARAWAARVTIDSSTVRGVRVDSARAELTGDSAITFDTLTVRSGAIRADGSGTLAFAAPGRGASRVAIRSDSLGVFEPWIGDWLRAASPDVAGLSGRLTAAVTGTGSIEEHAVSIDLEARDVRRGAIASSVIRGTGHWQTPDARFRFEVSGDSAEVGPLPIRTVTASAAGRRTAFSWNGNVALYTDATLAAWGSAIDTGTTVIGLDSVIADLDTSRWISDSAAFLSLSDSTVNLSRLGLTNTRGPGNIVVSGRLPSQMPGAVEGRVEAVRLADVFQPFGPDYAGAAGTIAGTFRFTGTASRPSFDVDVAVHDGAFRTLRTSLVEGNVRYRERQLEGTFTAHALGRRLVTATGRVPVDLALADVETRRIPGSLEIRGVVDSVGLTMFEPFVGENVRNLQGTVVADVTVLGSWQQPDLSGHMRLIDGGATLPALGVRHRAAEARLALSGNTVRVEQASVTSGGGTATLSGLATVSDLANPDLDLRLRAQEFRLINRPDLLALTASGDVTLRGPFTQATLAGRGVLNRGDLYATDLLEKQVVNLADTMFAAYVDTTVLRQEATASFRSLPFVQALRIDTLRFRLGSEVWMRSSEADVQLAGDVSVIKRGEDYRLNGTLTATRGFYRLQLGPAVTRDFVVTRGEIRFLGTPDLNADLDIDTQHQIRSTRGAPVTVNAHLGGTVYQPRLTLSSDVQPPLSETEIVSYLLFGAPSVHAFAESGGNQGRFVFEQSVDRFANVLAGEIERSLLNGLGVPLDYLQIRPGEFSRGFSGTEIALGKQLYVLGRPVFLVASPRLCTDQLVSTSNVGASLEFRVTRRWLVAASVDPLRACEVSTHQSSTRYQLGWDVFWETGR